MVSFPLCGRDKRRRRGERLPRDDPLSSASSGRQLMNAPSRRAKNRVSWASTTGLPEHRLMKNFDSRTYSVNDFVEWDKQKQLELNPFFQRRSVWSNNAKSYLIDTILKGKPIPKVFIRQKLNVTTRTSVREVVDGQQRLRTILSFVKDGFTVNRRHNREYGGVRFSQLPMDVQELLLTYELSVDLLINLPDRDVLDIFGRLNSYAINLNEQERINSNHFGPFKILADEIGYKYNEYWITQRIINPRAILRMQEINLVADLLIAMKEGIRPKKQIKRFYDLYEENFDDDPDDITERFDDVIGMIGKIYPEGIVDTEFTRVHLFYSLFTTVFHCMFELPGLEVPPVALTTDSEVERARNGLDRVGGLFSVADLATLRAEERQFVQDSRRATTDAPVRERRTKFLLSIMS